MNNRVVAFKIIRDYLVAVQFQDGFQAKVNLEQFLNKGFAKELLNKKKFAELSIEDGGGLTWPNGFDICPNFLRELANKNPAEEVSV
ncbi:DUF2442 domain-containing protein [Aequorivita marina]|uniref:DUF2442 domain-containing protein n=1 Tax=Aequorivita marina TaxID=3073654 RepID=UPI0028768D98|nr:DUF2442 domain-containing protein [Aequorivita sp. S2608]MDS1297250.1 DUF2442 domain-containing protein [Aequorivita sp. S2608]